MLQLLQDKDGYIWVGSEIGLQRYDGYHFQNYFYDLGIQRNLQNNIVKDLLVHAAGNILVGTWGDGIHIFNPESNSFSDFEFIRQNDTIPLHRSIQCLNQNKDGSFWIGTHAGLLFYASYSQTSRSICK